ncbi:ras GTPase-activating protein nGAP isoform X1 [Polypterus senegalus]
MGTTSDAELVENDMQNSETSNSPIKIPMGSSVSSEDDSPLKTYKWHTGMKQAIEGLRSEGSAGDKEAHKGASKWSKMSNWRKAFSEEAAAGEHVSAKRLKDSPKKVDDLHGVKTTADEKPPRKSPFRRALSEPPGSMRMALTKVNEQPVGATEEQQSPTERSNQKTTVLRKYLRSVSQRFKKPRAAEKKETPQKEDVMKESQDIQLSPPPSWAPPQEVPVWDINNCTLHDGCMIISRDDEPVYRTRNRISSCVSEGSLHNLAGSRGNLDGPSETVSQRPIGGVKSKIIRKFKPSLGKSYSHSHDDIGSGDSSMRPHGSQESLSISMAMAESLDLSGEKNLIIRPLHSSILGEKYCFEVITSEGSRCFGCGSAAERDRWIENLRRSSQPNKDNCQRTENVLSFWVNEAKDLPPKKKYFCELHLNGSLYARTISKTSTSGNLFWGELFELDNLPPVNQMTLYIFKDDEGSKKRTKEENVPLGSVAISLPELTGRQFVERWYPVTGYLGSASKDRATIASLRIKARYQNILVLPIEKYKDFAEYITFHYMDLCVQLEPILTVKEKEELACALVHVLQSIGKAKDFLKDLGIAEVDRFDEKESLIFRENTLATKAIDEYMKLVGQKYLTDTLGNFISQVYESGDICEVDPQKCSPNELPENQRNLQNKCEEVFRHITEEYSSFPAELNEIFSTWQEECAQRDKPDIGKRLICASLFLRFLCPAIMNPSLFNLMQECPEDSTSRKLTLTAKVIQNLANFTQFGDKEEYMLFMNDFLQQNQETMTAYLQNVSNPDSEVHMSCFDGYVDLPLRLSILHGLLCAIIAPKDQTTINNLKSLPIILNQISDDMGSDCCRINVSNFIKEETKPVYVPPKSLDKFSPLHNSHSNLMDDKNARWRKERKSVKRTQSVPARTKKHTNIMNRQASNQELTPEQHQLDISYPDGRMSRNVQASTKGTSNQVPWVHPNQLAESNMVQKINEGQDPLQRLVQEMVEIRREVDTVTDREFEMSKRLEDFIVQTQEQQTALQEEVQSLKEQLKSKEEQLTNMSIRLETIEEERKEDEIKLDAAMAAVERMNTLEMQYADLVTILHEVRAAQMRYQAAPAVSENCPVENGERQVEESVRCWGPEDTSDESQ